MTLEELNRIEVLEEGFIDSLLLKIKNSDKEFKEGTTEKQKHEQVDKKMNELIEKIEKDLKSLRQKLGKHAIGDLVSDDFRKQVQDEVYKNINKMRRALKKHPEKILNMKDMYLEDIAYEIIQANARKVAKKMGVKGIHKWASTNVIIAAISKFI